MAKVKKEITKKELTKKKVSKKTTNKVKTKTNTSKKNAPKKSTSKAVTKKTEKVIVEIPVEVPVQKVVEVDLSELKNEKSKKSFRHFITRALLSTFVIVGGITIGVALYKPIETTASGSMDANCTYGEWKEQNVTYCLVSPDGKYFSNDTVIYEYNKDTGMCIKKTRVKTCHY